MDEDRHSMQNLIAWPIAGLIVVGLVFGIAECSKAAELEFAAGVAKHKHYGDGDWMINELPHDLNLRSEAFILGLRGDFSQWLGWHVDYVNLGKVSSIADACRFDDMRQPGNYSAPCDNPAASPTGQINHFVGHGWVHGIQATAEPRLHVGSVSFGIQAGAFVYYARFDVHVNTVNFSGPDPFDYNHADGMGVSPVFGPSVTWNIDKGSSFGIEALSYPKARQKGEDYGLTKSAQFYGITISSKF